jgi:succinate-acetate transporter protein
MGFATATDGPAMGCYMFMWGLYTLCMFIATLAKSPRALQFVFFTVVVLFALLALHFWTENAIILRVAGIEGIICGLSALYVAFGEILNESYGRTVIPLFPMTSPEIKTVPVKAK